GRATPRSGSRNRAAQRTTRGPGTRGSTVRGSPRAMADGSLASAYSWWGGEGRNSGSRTVNWHVRIKPGRAQLCHQAKFRLCDFVVSVDLPFADSCSDRAGGVVFRWRPDSVPSDPRGNSRKTVRDAQVPHHAGRLGRHATSAVRPKVDSDQGRRSPTRWLERLQADRRQPDYPSGPDSAAL